MRNVVRVGFGVRAGGRQREEPRHLQRWQALRVWVCRCWMHWTWWQDATKGAVVKCHQDTLSQQSARWARRKTRSRWRYPDRQMGQCLSACAPAMEPAGGRESSRGQVPRRRRNFVLSGVRGSVGCHVAWSASAFRRPTNQAFAQVGIRSLRA
jgi:hypothetical protein